MLCIWVFAYMYVCVPLCAWCPQKSEEGIRFLPGIEITDGCKVLCGCWESHLSPLQKQLVLLIVEPSSKTPNMQN